MGTREGAGLIQCRLRPQKPSGLLGTGRGAGGGGGGKGVLKGMP